MASTLNTANLNDLADSQIQHVYPTFGRTHITDRRDQCWCQPRIEFTDGGAVIIHEVGH